MQNNVQRDKEVAGYRRWVWRGIEMQLPADWEMLLFSRRLEDGSCTFADRYQYRMQVAWRVLEGEPDVARTMQDYAGKIRHEYERENVETREIAGWPGVGFMEKDGRRMFRFIRYFREPSILLEVIFPAEEADPAPKEHILGNMVAGTDLSRWCGLGLNVKVPEGLRLSACEARPGAASMRFVPAHAKDDSGDDEYYFVRLGMLKRWLKGTTRDWLRLQIPAGSEIEASGDIHEGGHDGAWLTGKLPRKSWLRALFSVPRRFAATAWICPGDGRLYMGMRKCRSAEVLLGAHRLKEKLLCCA